MDASATEAAAERKWMRAVNATLDLHTSGTAVEGKRTRKPVKQYPAGPAKCWERKKRSAISKRNKPLLSNSEVVAAGKLHQLRFLGLNVHYPPLPDISSEDDQDLQFAIDAPGLPNLELSAGRCKKK